MKTKLTLAQAEVAAALYALNVGLPQIEPEEVFPRKDNAHKGARRTCKGLIKKGLIVPMPPGHEPRWKVTQELFDSLFAWRNDPNNYEAFEAFELSCY